MSLENPQVTSNAPELAAFCLVIGGLSIKMLDSVAGKLKNLDKYIASRPWGFLKTGGETYTSYVRYFQFIIITCLFMCPVTLFVWAGTLFYVSAANEMSMIGPVAVLVVGIFVICVILGVFYIKWQHYRPTVVSTSLLLLGVAGFFVYQICGNFLDVDERSFFGISAIFIGYNSIVVMFMIFLHSGRAVENFEQIYVNKIEERLSNYVLDQAQDFATQIVAQQADKKFEVSREEIDHFYTIPSEEASLFKGGVVRMFADLGHKQQFLMSLLLYAISVGILVGYAFIIYNSTAEYKLGFITLIAVLTTDTIIFSFYYVGLSKSVFQLCLMSIIFRVCLFGFGGTYWFYGYCVLYGILGIFVSANIAAKYFPLIDAIQADTAAKASGIQESKYLRDLMKTPEFILIYSTIMFAILTVALAASEPEGVPLTSLYSGKTEYRFWSCALLAFGIVVFSYLILAIIRILIRKNQKIIDEVHVFLFVTFFDIFWIHVYLCYAFIIIAGIIAYALSNSSIFLICACFLPLAVIFLIFVYLHYIANDYHILRDISAENKKRAYMAKLKEKARKRQSVANAEGAQPEPEALPESEVKAEPDNKPNPEAKTDREPGKESPPPSPLKGMTGEGPAEEHKQDDPRPGNPDPAEEPLKAGEHGAKESVVPPQGEGPNEHQLEASQRPSVLQSRSVLGYATHNQNEPQGTLELALKEAEASEPLPDWRVKYFCLCAFLFGKLHASDYKIIIGLIAIVVLIFLNSLTIQLVNDYQGAWHGVTLGFTLFDTFLCVAPLFRFLRTDLPLGPGQITAISIGLIVHVVYGILYFVGHESADMSKNSNRAWVLCYVVFIPAAISIGSGIYKYYHRSWRVNIYTTVMTFVTLGLLVIFTIFMWAWYGWGAAIAIIIIAGIIVYGAIMTYFYAANNYYLPWGFKLASLLLVVLACCAVMVASWVVDGFEPFIGFSITYALIAGGCLLYFTVKLIASLFSADTMPLFISPCIMPVYVFSPSAHTSLSSHFYVIGQYLSIAAALFWSILLSIYLRPISIGISVGCLVIVLTVFLSLFLVTYTPMLLSECKEFITKEVLSVSWISAKKKFVESQHAINMMELVSYSELEEYHKAVSERRKKEGFERMQLTSQQVLNIDIEKLNEKQQHDLLFDIEEIMRERFEDEIHLMIDYQLMCTIAAVNARLNLQTRTFNFLKSKETQLKTYGINILYRGIPDTTIRHSLIMMQYKKLTPEQQTKYNELFEEYNHEQEELRKKNEEREKAAQAAEEARNKKMMELAEKKKQQLAAIEDHKDMPIDEMPDCIEKYNKILAKYKDDSQLYEDKQFPPSEISLGSNVKARVNAWKRATPDMVLYDKTINAMDVKQGALGDCYYLSAISVLGASKVKACILTQPEDVRAGVCCVRFPKTGEKDDIVIIDTQFPQMANEWAFVRSETNLELWPMVLEKAYAKLYGSYENIEAGKVQYALADLTGGEPEQIKLETVSDNLVSFWARIIAYYKAGYLMGAGTPEHEMGDRAINENGIVQGHAYSILQLAEYESEKLIKLRNPHGSRGTEWSGDWADGSPKWTEAAKNKLGCEEAEDGVFWMALQDFVSEYKNLYICRSFDKTIWKHLTKEVGISINGVGGVEGCDCSGLTDGSKS